MSDRPPPPRTPAPGRSAGALLAEAGALDEAVYAAIARTPTPATDRAMRSLSRAADYSRVSIAQAAVLALADGGRGRRAALEGMTCVAVTSVVANLVVKPLGRRRRPDRAVLAVPADRHVPMPDSRSFPSGHAACAFAFASGASRHAPALGPPTYLVATIVAYSRVHTGVHFPGDVVAGALLGLTIANAISGSLARR